MSNVSVYSFADATGLTQYVDSVGDFQFTGTWSSTGTYFASPLTAAQYGVGLYMCIRDNVGDNPQRVPTRTRPASWSIMSLLYEYQSGSVSPTDALAQAAYDLAVSGTNIAWSAYYLAQIGTNTGSAAYNLAGSAIGVANSALSVANGAFSIAVAGTNAAASALSTANSAFSIAVIGTNVGSEALSIASAAYALAQIGTNTGTAALNIATSGSSVAWQAYLIAVAGSNNASDGSLAYAAWELAQIGTNTGSTAYSVAQTAYAIAQAGTAYATGSTFGQIRTAGDLVGPAQAPVVASAGSAFAFLGSNSPSGHIANQVDDYNPASLAITSILRLNPDPVFVPTLTGLAGGTPGRIIFVYNTSSTASITFAANNAGSSSSNRFAFSANVVLLPQRGFFVIYDGILSNWLLFNPCVWLAGDLGGTEGTPIVTGASQSFSFKGQLNPTIIGSDQNNYAPGSTATIYELSSSLAVNITGLSIGNSNGQIAFLYNIGTFPITLVNESSASNPSNRFKFGVDWVLNPGSTVAIWHNASTARWQIFGFDPQYVYSIASAAYAIAQIGTNTGTAAYNLAQQAYTLALSASGSAAGTVALDAYHLAQIGTNTGSTAYSVAQTAYSIAQIGTNTGSTAYSVAQTAYSIAQIGTNTGSTAYSVAQAAWALAQIGTNTGTAAYNLATSGSSVAWQAYLIATNGSGSGGGSTDGVSTLPWAGTITIDFTGSTYQRVTLLGSTFFTGANYTAGRAVSVEITGTADTSVSFNTSWKRLGNFASAISAGATGWVGLVSVGTTASNVDAVYAATDFQIGTLVQDYAAYYLAQIGTNTGSTAYSVAQTAYSIAQIGTNTGSTAYSVAQAAYALAVIGTGAQDASYGSVSTANAVSGTMYYNFNSYTYQETTVGTNIWISGTNMAAARELVVILVPDGTTHNLGFDAFKFFGTTAPTSISTKEIMITFVCKDGTLGNTRAAWIQQA